jgi:hypothetical protein
MFRGHCPVPIFLCFDLVQTIAMDGVRFSTGNMASNGVTHDETLELFEQLPFASIYHTGGMPPESIQELKFRRHAEVLVPRQLPLNHKLRMIACRSAAEHRTLLSLMTAAARTRWGEQIRIGFDSLFERKWWYITNVHAQGRFVTIDFNGGPLPIALRYDRTSWRVASSHLETTMVAGQTRLVVDEGQPIEGIVKILLNGHLAFKDTIQSSDAPF